MRPYRKSSFFPLLAILFFWVNCGPEKVCGPNCPKSTYKSEKICDTSCSGDCSQGKTNASICSHLPLTRATFHTCDSDCPKGYVVHDFICDEKCGPCEGKTNALECEDAPSGQGSLPPVDQWKLTRCQNGPPSCPSNYHLSSFFCDFAASSPCGFCIVGQSTNAYTCELNSPPSFSVCKEGKTCPSGYHQTEDLCLKACDPLIQCVNPLISSAFKCVKD